MTAVSGSVSPRSALATCGCGGAAARIVRAAALEDRPHRRWPLGEQLVEHDAE